MSSEAEVSPTRPFEGDRGVRVTGQVPMSAFFEFKTYIHLYQHEHPDTLVRTTQEFHTSTKMGSIRVRWWQRGTPMPEEGE